MSIQHIIINKEGIKRLLMPQMNKIKDRDREKFSEGLHLTALSKKEKEEITVKPSQLDLIQSKIDFLISNPDEIGSIIVSADGFILDGHHNWYATCKLNLFYELEILQSVYDFDNLYMIAHCLTTKLGIKKSIDRVAGTISGLTARYNRLAELTAEFITDTDPETATPMATLIDRKTQRLENSIEKLNLDIAIARERINDKIAETNFAIVTLKDKTGKAQAKKKANIQKELTTLEDKKIFFEGLISKIGEFNISSKEIASHLAQKFINGTISVEVDALAGSIFQFCNLQMVDIPAALEELGNYTKEPRKLLDRINSQIDNLAGFDPGKVNCDMDALAVYDLSYPTVYHAAKRRSDEAKEEALRLSQSILLSAFASAGKTWVPKPILELQGDVGFKVSETYEGSSVVKSNGGDSFSMPLKESEDKPMSPAGKKFLAGATAESMAMPILLSAGGGMQLLNPVFLKVFRYVTESLVDIKAYIASANSSAVRKTISTECYVGTQVHILYKDGSPVLVNNKPVAIRSAAEGSHWFPRDWGYAHKLQNQTSHVACQIRGLSEDFVTDIIQPAAESYGSVVEDLNDWLAKSKSALTLLGQNIFFSDLVDGGEIKVLDELKSQSEIGGNYQAMVVLTTKEEFELRCPSQKSWSPTQNLPEEKRLKNVTSTQARESGAAYKYGKTIAMPFGFDFWTFGGELTQEEFSNSNMSTEEKKAYLAKLQWNIMKKLVPRSLQGIVKVNYSNRKHGEKSHLTFVLKGPTRSILKVSYYIAMIARQQLANQMLLEKYPYWETFEASSYEDFMIKVKSGHKFAPALTKAIKSLKDQMSDLIDKANSATGRNPYMTLTHLQKRRGQPINEWANEAFANLSFGAKGSSICAAKRGYDEKVEVPEYSRKTLWGWPSRNFSIFVKGIAIDHVGGFIHLDGSQADDIPVISGLDGVKCEHKNLVVGKTEEALAEHYHMVDFDDPTYGVAANGFKSFKTLSIAISKEKERISLGIMKIFKTSKVVVTSQFLEKLPTDLFRGETSSKDVIYATEESSRDFIDYLASSWDWMQEAFEILRSIPTGPIETSDYFEEMEDVDDKLSPSKLFRNLMAVNSRHLQGPTFWEDIEDSLISGKNADTITVMNRCGGSLVNSLAYQTAVTESVNSRLQEACKGSSVKAKYFVVKNFELLPDKIMVVHKQYRTKWGIVEGAAYRFPIATATSLMNVKVVFSDDKDYLPTLMEAGICDHAGEMADVILMNSSCKVWFQQDDDGDQFGLIIDPRDPTTEDFATLQWHVKNAGTSYSSQEWKDMIVFARKLYKKLEAKVVIALTKLRRADYPSVDIEMETIPGGKALFKFLDENGTITSHFKELAAEDLRGPVGLVSDLMTVILASGEHGHELARVARTLGYILQHCIDSAKKNKLMIPAYVLMHIAFWILNQNRYEMVSGGNEAVILWNEAWAALDLAKIKELEEKYEYLPSHQMILDALYYDSKYLYYAPATLLTHLQKKAKPGAYGEIELFGKSYPVPASAQECIDETRYISAHVFNIVDVKDSNGKRRSWSQMSRFRNILIQDYLNVARRKVEVVKNGVKSEQWRLFWPEVCDGDGYVSYWTKDPNAKVNPGFAGTTTQSIPNYIFKEQLRFSMEMIFGGKDALVAESTKWQKPDGMDTAFKTKLQHSYTSNAYFAGPLGNGGPKVSKILMKNGEPWLSSDRLGTIKKKAQTWAIGILGARKVVDHRIILDKLFVETMCAGREKSYIDLLGPDGIDFEEAYVKLMKDKEDIANMMLDDLRQVLWTFVVHQLAQNCWVEKGPEKVYSANLVQNLFAISINGVFSDEITKKGREPDRVYQIPKYGIREDNPSKWAFQRKPDNNWFKGDWSVWKSFAMGAANDLVIKALARLPIWSPCGFTSTIDLERDGCVVESEHEHRSVSHVVKAIDEKALNQVVTNYSVGHLKLAEAGEEAIMLHDCANCMKEIRSQVAKIQRSSISVPGTAPWKDRQVALAAVKTSITCLESVKFQAKTLMMEAMETESPTLLIGSICKESGFDIAPETVKLYAGAYGDSSARHAFGFVNEDDASTYENWQRIVSSLDEERLIYKLDSIQALNQGEWFTLPIPYLVYAIGKDKPVALSEWEEDDTDPTPPSGGGGGSSQSPEIAQEIERIKAKLKSKGIKAEIIVAETAELAWEAASVGVNKIVHIHPTLKEGTAIRTKV